LAAPGVSHYIRASGGMGIHTESTARPTLNPLVLIVEDDLSTRLLYREYLQHDGFRTVDAHNGHQALEKARVLCPNAVLTDLAVPGMDGFEFCRALRESPATRSIPILAVTGHSEYLDEPDRFAQAGITHVLIKPCAPDIIAYELRRLLGNARATLIS
jgi:two-component system, cell cycle response regulator DivK